MDPDKILARRNAVYRKARSYGYEPYRAEEIAQEAALQLLENEKRQSQSAQQAFIDCLRSSGNADFSKGGKYVTPLFENKFEDYVVFLNRQVTENDFEARLNFNAEVRTLFSMFHLLQPMWQEAMEQYLSGKGLKEVGRNLGVSEARVSQIITLACLELREAVAVNQRAPKALLEP